MFMKKCPNCGIDVNENLNICPCCGKKIEEDSIVGGYKIRPLNTVDNVQKKNNGNTIVAVKILLIMIFLFGFFAFFCIHKNCLYYEKIYLTGTMCWYEGGATFLGVVLYVGLLLIILLSIIGTITNNFVIAKRILITTCFFSFFTLFCAIMGTNSSMIVYPGDKNITLHFSAGGIWLIILNVSIFFTSIISSIIIGTKKN